MCSSASPATTNQNRPKKSEQVVAEARPHQGPQAAVAACGRAGEDGHASCSPREPSPGESRRGTRAGRARSAAIGAGQARSRRRHPRRALAHGCAQRRRHRAQGAGRALRVAGGLGGGGGVHVPGLGLRLHRHRPRRPGGDHGRCLRRHHRFHDADPRAGPDHATHSGGEEPGDPGADPHVAGPRLGAGGRKVARSICVLHAAHRHHAGLRGAAGDLRAGQDLDHVGGHLHPGGRPGFRAHRGDVCRHASGRRGGHRDRRPGVERDEEPGHRLRPLPGRPARHLVRGVPPGFVHSPAFESLLRLCCRLLPLPGLQPRPGLAARQRVLPEPRGRRAVSDDSRARVATLAMSRWARRARAGSLSLFVTTIVLALLVAANVLASKSTQAIDLTRGGLNTLAPQSVLAAKRLTSDLQVIGIFRAGAGNGQTEAEALIGLYAAQNAHVKYRRADADTDLADVNRYKVKRPNTLVLDYKGKSELLTRESQGEVDVTAALVKLESDRVPLVCWAIGDGERSLGDKDTNSGYSGVADILAKNNFASRDLLASQVTSIPGDCDEVAVVAPTKPLIAAEPWQQDLTVTASLSEVLKPYGLGFSGALIVETDPAHNAGNQTIPAATQYGVSPITANVKGIAAYFPQSTPITGTPDPAATSVAIARTTSGAFAVSSPRTDYATRKAGDAGGPFTMMETLEEPAGQKKTRIVVSGSGALAENLVLPPNAGGANLEIALASFQWLAEQDALISIPPKPQRALPLPLTQQDQSTLIFITGVLLPGLMVFGGVMVWWRRRVFS